MLNDQELEGTKKRIARFQDILAQLRITATQEEFPFVSSSYKAEIEKMQAEVLDYLTRHSSEPLPAKIA